MNVKGHKAMWAPKPKKLTPEEKAANLEARKAATAATRAQKPKGRGKMGRPNRDEQLQLQDYIDALTLAEGRYIPAAEALGVTVDAVWQMTQRHPELMAVRNNRKRRRIEVALGVVDQMISPTNKDKQTKLRASLFTLNTESEEHAEKSQTTLSGEITVNLPTLNINFISPKKA